MQRAMAKEEELTTLRKDVIPDPLDLLPDREAVFHVLEKTLKNRQASVKEWEEAAMRLEILLRDKHKTMKEREVLIERAAELARDCDTRMDQREERLEERERLLMRRGQSLRILLVTPTFGA